MARYTEEGEYGPSDTNWTLPSAVWQIAHGESNSDKTVAARAYMDELVESPNCYGNLDTAEKAAITALMDAIDQLRDDLLASRTATDVARAEANTMEENRTKHKLYTAALQVKTYEHKYAGSKQVPRMWVEASSAAEAQRIMSDIVNTAVRCSYVSLVSPVIQEVEAALIWAEQEN